MSAQISAQLVRTAEKPVAAASALSTVAEESLPIKLPTPSMPTTLAEVPSMPTPAPTPSVAAPEVQNMDLAEKQATADQAMTELLVAQQIADDEAFARELMKEFTAKDEAAGAQAQMAQQLAEMPSAERHEDLPSTSTTSEVDQIPDHQLPAERLRYEQIEEMSYKQPMNHVKYEAAAVACKKLKWMSDYYGTPIAELTLKAFESQVCQNLRTRLGGQNKLLQMDIEKFPFIAIQDLVLTECMHIKQNVMPECKNYNGMPINELTKENFE